MIGFEGVWRNIIDYLGIRVTSRPDDDEPIQLRMQADAALRYPPVWYAVNKIAGHIGYLPLNVHRESGRNIEKDTTHPMYRLMRWAPNPTQTPLQFKRSLTADALLWGNGYAYIHRVGTQIAELVPMYAGAMVSGLDEGRKIFLYHANRNERIPLPEDMETNPEQVVMLEASQVLHIHGLGFNGLSGYSLIKLAADAWQAGTGATKRINSSMVKGYSGGLMLEAPAGAFRKEQDAQEFLEHFRRTHGGADNAGKTGMLREGIKANMLAMSNSDAQFVETMKFLRQDEALRFMLESILGDDASVSYNSLEQKNLAYLQNCLNTWLKVWEEECDTKLLTEREQRSGYYFKFNDGALLRSDKETTMRTINMGIASRVLSPNEGRELLDMNPYDGGDSYENPAITPSNGTNQRGGQPDTEPSRQPANNATLVHVEHMIGVEAKRATQAAASSKNFCAWIDDFYAKWVVKLADDVERLGGDRHLAERHCKESMEQLLNCADKAKPETLEDVVRDCVTQWPTRAAALANEMEMRNV